MRILYVGPAGFNPNTWRTRAEYILPDLFSGVPKNSELYILTGPLPEFARDPMQQLCSKFSVHHIEVKEPSKYGDSSVQWREMVKSVASKIKPDVITNSLGSLRLGEAIGLGAKHSGARSVIRVAGDEIGSRVAMGKYDNNNKWLLNDKKLEKAGFENADTIITMSPWESDRIKKISANFEGKTKICIRGVDLNRFSPTNQKAFSLNPKRFLYVGRKSAEKGYDLIEEASKIIFTKNREIEFVFVGDFDKGQIDNRQYIGWVETSDLPNFYLSVDAFVLTSRTEGFPQVLVEAMASGLPCILSKPLFNSVFKHKKDVLLTELTPVRIAEAILTLATNRYLAGRLALRSRQIALKSFDQSLWRERYSSIVKNKYVKRNTIIDTENARGSFTVSAATTNEPLRIAYILPRIFGLMGTQGSYGVALAFKESVPTLIISKEIIEVPTLPIVFDDKNSSNHFKVNFASEFGIEKIVELVTNFKPSIVHFVNDHSWVRLLPLLKEKYPSARYVLDLQTPLLLPEGTKRDKLQDKGNKKSHMLDLVISLSVNIAKSWIPSLRGDLLPYPLGIDVKAISKSRNNKITSEKLIRLIYVGQLHPLRKIPKLIELISTLNDEKKKRLSVDIYGAGGGENDIDEAIKKFQLADIVKRHAPLPQKDLFEVISTYHAGIAWVPRGQTYDEAPSLKFLEYAAAGIGILATNTPAHERNIVDGFNALLFEENSESFSSAVQKLLNRYFTEVILNNNEKVVQRYDFKWIADNVLLPKYRTLLSGTTVETLKLAHQDTKARLLFVSPNPLGLIATPGTYLSVEAYSEHFDVHVIAKPKTKPEEIIVHEPNQLTSVTLLDPQNVDYLEQVKQIADSFKPDLVCIGSHPNWHVIVEYLKIHFNHIPIVLEVKSPILSKNMERLKRLRKAWKRAHLMLDGVIAPSQGMVETFVTDLKKPLLVHRSIINYNQIKKCNLSADRKFGRKIIFCGSLSHLRKIERILNLLSKLPLNIKKEITIDIYGDGEAYS